MRLMMFKNLYFSSLFCLLTLKLISIHAANIQVLNNCSFTVWAAATPGGGRLLEQGQDWVFNLKRFSFHNPGSIWARTDCKLDIAAYVPERCEVGDCHGILYCSAGAPITVAEYSLNKFNNMDFFDISLLYGFNVPMELSGNSSKCTKVVKCLGDINDLCPTELRHPSGCRHPCTVFKNNQFCCDGPNGGPENCDPAEAYFKFFKNLCPDVYTYPYDDATGLFTCPTGSDYKVVFCP